MSDSATSPDKFTGPTPDNAMRQADQGPVLAADGTPLKRSLARSLRVQKLRALGLIAPLLIFVLVSFIIPIADMLFRSVENEMVGNTMPLTSSAISQWDSTDGGLPGEGVYQAAWFDMFIAAEAKKHTKLGTRLNYQLTGISSLFRQSGRKVDDLGKDYGKALKKVDADLNKAGPWLAMMTGDPNAPRADELMKRQRERVEKLVEHELTGEVAFAPSEEIATLLPVTSREYAAFANYMVLEDGKSLDKAKPWEALYTALAVDLQGADLAGYEGPGADLLRAAAASGLDPPVFKDTFADIDEDWVNPQIWATINLYMPDITPGYFLNAVDMQLTPEGVQWQPENKQILLTLFGRTIWMSLVITFMCVLLAYPIAYLLANLRARTANLLLILVLLPFWTSLLVRTSAWKVMLQQQGVINDVLVWLGLVGDADRLVMINNQFGTITAMTHILLPFMILPMYSVMQTIPPSYVRAARSLGATNWTSFWRVYFPQSVPGIGAGSILVFILAIGYYITPEIVGGTKGVFISNRIAYHISSSLNWGLAAALGAILLAVVLILYWAYDKIVGIDNVKLG